MRCWPSVGEMLAQCWRSVGDMLQFFSVIYLGPAFTISDPYTLSRTRIYCLGPAYTISDPFLLPWTRDYCLGPACTKSDQLSLYRTRFYYIAPALTVSYSIYLSRTRFLLWDNLFAYKWLDLCVKSLLLYWIIVIYLRPDLSFILNFIDKEQAMLIMAILMIEVGVFWHPW